jgi:N-acetylmuramoyl-L-alanine amidase
MRVSDEMGAALAGACRALAVAVAIGMAAPAAQAQGDATGRPQAAPPAKPASGWSPSVQKASPVPRTAPVARKLAAAAVASVVSIQADAGRTTFSLGLSRSVNAEAYTLDAPRRVVVDLPDVAFRLAAGAGEKGGGLISAFRFGLIEAGKARVVMDLAAPARIAAAQILPARSGAGSELRIVLEPTEAATFAAAATRPAAPAATVDTADPLRRKARPVIVIDPGHGGIDPGARGASNVQEKTVTLAVARQLRQILMAAGRYNVFLTRTGDVFVSLDQRLRISQQYNADLFISIHADSIAATQLAQSVRGATVYTLSDKASDEAARLLAEKENAADVLAGMETVAAEDKDQVKSILIDLLKRETSNFSHAFSRLLVTRMRQSMALAKDPERSAAFKVLRQTNSPSVLIELGYMTNAEDERLLQSVDWQKQVAAAVAGAVDAYFSKRTAGQ